MISLWWLLSIDEMRTILFKILMIKRLRIGYFRIIWYCLVRIQTGIIDVDCFGRWRRPGFGCTRKCDFWYYLWQLAKRYDDYWEIITGLMDILRLTWHRWFMWNWLHRMCEVLEFMSLNWHGYWILIYVYEGRHSLKWND